LSGLFFDPEDGGYMFLWNVDFPSPDYTALFQKTRLFTSQESAKHSSSFLDLAL
jgi:hypothetical protein